MNRSIAIACIILGLLFHVGNAQAALILKAAGTKTYGQKTVVKMELQNTFTNVIESARAVVFLLDDVGKVVGQETRWIIGGSKEKPILPPDSKMTFNFVVQSAKPFVKTKIVVTRLVLEGGRVADANKDSHIESP